MNCIACKSEMPEGAYICKNCQSYQVKWRNWLPHIGTALALVTFILAGFAYIWQSGSKIAADLLVKDRPQIVFLDSEGESGFINAGDRDIILLDIEISLKQFRRTTNVAVFKRLAPAEFIVVNSGGNISYKMDNLTLATEDPNTPGMDIECYNNESSILKANKEFFQSLKTLPATGVLTYYSTIDKKQKTLSIECECIIVRPNEERKLPENNK
jgi:hypothetical protein